MRTWWYVLCNMLRLLLGKRQAVPSAPTQQPLFIYVILELFYSDFSHVVFTVSRTQFVRAVVGLLLSWTDEPYVFALPLEIDKFLQKVWKICVGIIYTYEEDSKTFSLRVLRGISCENYRFTVKVSELGLSWGIYWGYPGIYLHILKKKHPDWGPCDVSSCLCRVWV